MIFITHNVERGLRPVSNNKKTANGLKPVGNKKTANGLKSVLNKGGSCEKYERGLKILQ